MKYKFRRQLLYILARIAATPLQLVPLKAGVGLGAFFGGIAYWILPGEKRKTLAHLRIAFGKEKSEKEISSIAKRVFSNLGRNALEWVNSPKLNEDWFIEHIKVEGRENIDRAHTRGKGTIFLISHFGNWEFLGFYLAYLAQARGVRPSTIARRFYIEAFNNLLVKMRTDRGIEVVYRGDSLKKVLRILKDNGYLGILADQDIRNIDGVFVDFFGKPAYTAVAPVKIAKKTGAAIVPVFLIRERNSRFRLIAEKEMELVSSGNEAEDLLANTAKWMKLFESYIQRYPDHWVWMHRRWKTRPEDVEPIPTPGV